MKLKLIQTFIILVSSTILHAKDFVCKISPNNDLDHSGEIKLQAITTQFGDIVDNQITLGTSITTRSGFFDRNLLSLYFHHPEIQCPKYQDPICSYNEEEKFILIKQVNNDHTRIEISLDLSPEIIEYTLLKLYPRSPACQLSELLSQASGEVPNLEVDQSQEESDLSISKKAFGPEEGHLQNIQEN